MNQIKNYISKYSLQTGVFTVLIILIGLFMILSPSTFLTSNIYRAYMSTIPFIAICALGLTPLIVVGEIDLSFTSAMAFSGFVFSHLYSVTGNATISLISGLVAGAIIGLINGLLVTKIGIPSMIATIGTQFFWRGLVTLLSDGLSRNIVIIRGTVSHSILVGRIGGLIPAQTIWTILIAIVLWFILNRHKYGDDIHFVGDNKETARIMGINVSRTKIFAFVQLGLLSGFAGILICYEMVNWWPTQGQGYLLPVFAAVFIGGTSVFGGKGTIFGTFIGAIIIGIIEAGVISAGISGFWTRLVNGLILIIAVSIYTINEKRMKT